MSFTKSTSLWGLPKVHKEYIPIRPLLDYTTAPAFKVSKQLGSLFKEHIVVQNNYSLKNIYHLIEKQNINILSHHTLASFDIVNIYTNVPIFTKLMDVEQDFKNSNLLTEAVY